MAVDLRPAGDERRAVERLELVEDLTVGRGHPVTDPDDHLARVERLLEVGRDQVEQPVGVLLRLGVGTRWSSRDEPVSRPPRLAPVQPRHDPPPDPDRVALVLGEVVGQARGPGVHLGAAERLVVGLLAGRHLHQRRAAEEHLGLLLDHHRVVAHAGHVGAAGGGVAEHQRDGRVLRGRRPGDVAEQLAARDEDLLLGRQVRAAGLDQRDRREPVLLGDLRGPEDLLDRPRVRGAALHRRVVGGDHALDALDHADAGDHATRRR